MFWTIILGTSIWVFFDAKTIGVKKGQIQGIANIGPTGWFFSCLLLWIISFPLYIAKRPEFKRINTNLGQEINNTAISKTNSKEGVSILSWIGIIFSVSIALLIFFGKYSNRTTEVSHHISSNTVQQNIVVNKGKFNDAQICMAAIALMNNREPIYDIVNFRDNETILNYTRNVDNKSFSYACRLSGREIKWRLYSQTNWSKDNQLFFTINGDSLSIRQTAVGETMGSKSFQFRELDF